MLKFSQNYMYLETYFSAVSTHTQESSNYVITIIVTRKAAFKISEAGGGGISFLQKQGAVSSCLLGSSTTKTLLTIPPTKQSTPPTHTRSPPECIAQKQQGITRLSYLTQLLEKFIR